LTKDGYKSEFIGTLVDAYPRCSATRSDGHSGYNTNNTNSEIPGWFAAIKKPELTVLMLGTNDVAWWMAEPVSAVVTRLSMLIDKIRANSPKGVIIVASIPPESSSVIDTVRVDRAKLVVDYNKGVSELIAKRKSVGEDIHFVDIFSVLTLADLYDGIHPNDAGNVKIGQAFYAKIKSLITAKPTPPTPVPPTPSPTPTPTSDPVPTGSTMKTNGRFLYDACGQKMVLRGVNHMTCWTDWAGTPRDGLPMFAEIAKTGANVVRMSWIRDAGAGTPAITTAQLDAAITNVIANKMVPMPELHDYTCNWSTQAITDVINWWTNPELTPILKKHQRYLLINFANEMSAPNVTEYVKEYSRALVALRAAGLHMPIVFDSSGCGQDENMILAAGPALIKADPDHNVIMSLHIYWTDQNAARIGTAMTNAVAADIPLIIGEFASVSVDCTTPILYKEIIKQAQLNEIGYLPWSWDHQNACGTHAMTKDVNQSFSTLWGWALEVAVTDPNSIKNTSVRSQCF
jgi:mannan endo-1,4-beta-mannosidase